MLKNPENYFKTQLLSLRTFSFLEAQTMLPWTCCD